MGYACSSFLDGPWRLLSTRHWSHPALGRQPCKGSRMVCIAEAACHWCCIAHTQPCQTLAVAAADEEEFAMEPPTPESEFARSLMDNAVTHFDLSTYK